MTPPATQMPAMNATATAGRRSQRVTGGAAEPMGPIRVRWCRVSLQRRRRNNRAAAGTPAGRHIHKEGSQMLCPHTVRRLKPERNQAEQGYEDVSLTTERANA
jgi:hypothetical protein